MENFLLDVEDKIRNMMRRRSVLQRGGLATINTCQFVNICQSWYNSELIEEVCFKNYTTCPEYMNNFRLNPHLVPKRRRK